MVAYHNNDKIDLYTTNELADALDIRVGWLRKNRKSDNPIPYRCIGRKSIRYSKQDVLQWVGRKDLMLKFYSTKNLAKKLRMSEIWLRKNRKSDDPIPFRKFNGLIRYNETEIRYWLNKQKHPKWVRKSSNLVL